MTLRLRVAATVLALAGFSSSAHAAMSSGTFTGNITTLSTATDVYDQHAEASGTDSLGGAFTIAVTDEFTFGTGNTFSISDGAFTLSFANGNITGTYLGSGTYDEVEFTSTDTFTIDGGTGVYAGITGVAQASVTATTSGAYNASYNTTYDIADVPLPPPFLGFGASLLGLMAVGTRHRPKVSAIG